MPGRFAKRPWGMWLVLLDRKRFKLKLLRFKAGGQLSNQYHNHRNEMWLFLKGKGVFYPQDIYKPVCAGDWVNVRVESLHSYRATTVTWVLEVQYGDKCVESDIARFS